MGRRRHLAAQRPAAQARPLPDGPRAGGPHAVPRPGGRRLRLAAARPVQGARRLRQVAAAQVAGARLPGRRALGEEAGLHRAGRRLDRPARRRHRPPASARSRPCAAWSATPPGAWRAGASGRWPLLFFAVWALIHLEGAQPNDALAALAGTLTPRMTMKSLMLAAAPPPCSPPAEAQPGQAQTAAPAAPGRDPRAERQGPEAGLRRPDPRAGGEGERRLRGHRPRHRPRPALGPGLPARRRPADHRAARPPAALQGRLALRADRRRPRRRRPRPGRPAGHGPRSRASPRTASSTWPTPSARGGGTNNAAVARGKLVLSAGAPRLEGVTGDLPPDALARLHQALRRPPGLRPRRDALRHRRRALDHRGPHAGPAHGRHARQGGPHQRRRLDPQGQSVRRPGRARSPRSSPSATATSWARPSIPTTGELWEVEHGARGGDELNIVRKGKDYGWPTIAYGIEYAGGPITGGITQKAGMEQPVYYWDPVIAPGGMAFYEADLFPAWKGSLFVAGLGSKHLARLTLDGDKVVGEERLLTEVGERLRDVVVGPGRRALRRHRQRQGPRAAGRAEAIAASVAPTNSGGADDARLDAGRRVRRCRWRRRRRPPSLAARGDLHRPARRRRPSRRAPRPCTSRPAA